MSILYIIDPSTFPVNGRIANSMTAPKDAVPTKVDYTNGLTFEEYDTANGNKFILLTPDEFSTNWEEPYRQSLQKPWVETTKERYYDALECLPPIKYRLISRYNTFFVGECVTLDLYDLYAENETTGKYYQALRSVTATVKELYDELKILEE
jgi:hypothetical protein